jgi:hypothetical protein
MSSNLKIDALFLRIYPSLLSLSGDYYIIGSAALLLSGIEILVHDVDILTSEAGAKRLMAIWKDFKNNSYRPEQQERFRSTFGRFDFEEYPVEVMGDLEVNRDGVWEGIVVKDFRTIALEGCSIKAPSLAEQKRIFLLFGREKDLEKVRMIERLGF